MAVGVAGVSDKMSISRSAGRLSGLQMVRASPERLPVDQQRQVDSKFQSSRPTSSPTCSMRRHIWLKKRHCPGDIRFRTPTRPKSLPSFAGTVLPPTGDSTKAAPCCNTAAPFEFIVSGRIVLILSRACRRVWIHDAVRSAINRLGSRVIQQQSRRRLSQSVNELRRGCKQLCPGIGQGLFFAECDSRHRFRAERHQPRRSMIPFVQFRIRRFSLLDLIQRWIANLSSFSPLCEHERRRDFERSALHYS